MTKILRPGHPAIYHKHAGAENLGGVLAGHGIMAGPGEVVTLAGRVVASPNDATVRPGDTVSVMPKALNG